PPAQAGDLPTFSRQSRHILAACRPAAVITTDDIAPLLELDAVEPRTRVLTLDHLICGPALAAPVQTSATAVALLQFTSGSTAAPKGVVLTHANIHANAAAIAERLQVRASDVGVSWLPLYHDMGLIGTLLGGLYASVELVVMSPVLFLKRPTAWLD